MRQGNERRAMFAVILGFAVLVGMGRGQEKAYTEIRSTGGESEAVVAGHVDAVGSDVIVGGKHAGGPNLADRVKGWWQSRIPFGCYSHFNDYTCSNFHSEFVFLFGGCRAFFGERCLKGPPPSPVPGFDQYRYDMPEKGPFRQGYGSHGHGQGYYGSGNGAFGPDCRRCR